MAYVIEVDPGLTTPAKAVSVWLAVLAHAKTDTLANLTGMPDDLKVTEDQVEALRANAHILAMVGHRGPVVSITVCPECTRWALSTEPSKTRCKLTLGCNGRPVRVPAAKRIKIPVELGLEAESAVDAAAAEAA